MNHATRKALLAAALWIGGLAAFLLLVLTSTAQDASPLLAIVTADDQWSPLRLSPAAWYQAEDNALDSSGFGRNGTWSSGAAYTNGVVGRAFLSSPTAFPSITIATTSGQAISIAAWVYSTETSTTYRCIFDCSVARPMIWFDGSGKIEFDAGYYRTSDALRGQWVHVALAKPAGNTLASYYVNGMLVSAGFSAYIVPEGSLTIFRRQTNTFPWRGFADDAIVWSRALTPAEIAELYDRSVKQNGAAWKVQ